MVELNPGAVHVASHLIDRYLAGLLDEAESASLEGHVRSCAACRSRLEEARGARAAFLQANPPEIRARQLLAPGPRPARWGWLAPLVLAPALAALLLVLRPWEASREPQPEVLLKGGALVTFEVQRAGARSGWQGRSGDRLRAGDAIRIRVDPPGPAHVTVLAVDHAGAVTRLMDVRAPGPTALPRSLVLDDAPEPEQILVVFSEAPVATEELQRMVQAAFRAASGRIEELRVPHLHGGVGKIVSFLVRKERSPTTDRPDVIPAE